MREDGAVSRTAVLTDIDPGCRAELNGFKPYLDTRIEVFNGQNGQKNVLAEAGKALSSGSLSATTGSGSIGAVGHRMKSASPYVLQVDSQDDLIALRRLHDAIC